MRTHLHTSVLPGSGVPVAAAGHSLQYTRTLSIFVSSVIGKKLRLQGHHLESKEKESGFVQTKVSSFVEMVSSIVHQLLPPASSFRFGAIVVSHTLKLQCSQQCLTFTRRRLISDTIPGIYFATSVYLPYA